MRGPASGLRPLLSRATGRSRRAAGAIERPLEPLLPGFVCASAAMQRVADQIQRLQGNDLTVLITGESGTGKDLVARAIHAGSPRRDNMFLPYNCTSATRELADSQLFGHRRGSFTGAVADQPGVLRTARRRDAVPRRSRRSAARRAAEAAAVPRAGGSAAGRRDPAAARRRPRRRGDQRRSRAARQRRQVPRGSVLPAERDPHPRAAAARAARGDSAPEHVLPPRSVRAAGQAGRATRPRDAGPLRHVRLARQRPPASERSPARGRDGPGSGPDHSGAAVAGVRHPRAGHRIPQRGRATGSPRWPPRSRKSNAR